MKILHRLHKYNAVSPCHVVNFNSDSWINHAFGKYLLKCNEIVITTNVKTVKYCVNTTSNTIKRYIIQPNTDPFQKVNFSIKEKLFNTPSRSKRAHHLVKTVS
jgi:hypothetical protein